MKQEVKQERNLTRRQFHGLGAAAVVAAASPWLASRADAGGHKLATEFPENETVLAAIQFVSESQREGQNCGNCLLFQAGEKGLGRCTILQKGLVPEGGWCLSWAAKP